MKRITLSVAVLAASLAFNPANAQMATQKGVILTDIMKHINNLLSQENEESKKQLAIELKALIESKNEEFVLMGARVYEFSNNKEAAEKANALLLKKFPKGIKARQNSFDTIFGNKETPLNTVEKNYNEWLKKFPPSNFNSNNQEIYNQALAKMATFCYENGASQQGNDYILQLENVPTFSNLAISISRNLMRVNKNQDLLFVSEKAFNHASNDKSKTGEFNLPLMTPIYASALNLNNQPAKAITILENFAQTKPLNLESTNILVDAYTKQAKPLDAFITISNFIRLNGNNEELGKKLEKLYIQLNGSTDNYNTYLASLKQQFNDISIAKYKSEMIKKEAPNFSLVNMKGETVSLKDLRGKVVILDFWATWCGPCKMSFPGMQASVNKFQNDKEVEFLFIDTWQREDNYKELVDKFITDNKYTFNVLFDEMKDRPKSTTTAYGVRGIPHKVIIDKEGFIRFESSGGIADVEKIVNEMSAKIELAKKG